MRRFAWCLGWLCLVLTGPALADSAVTSYAGPRQTPDRAACRIIESAARVAGISPEVLTRLVWVESRFHADAMSPAGALGIAQFMPGTANERGLLNPFDPEQAIPRAAELLADLELRFGNIGLAVAAYNAGPSRVGAWLAGAGVLAAQTEAYVRALTGRSAEDWASDRQRGTRAAEPVERQSCLDLTAALRAREAGGWFSAEVRHAELSGNFLTALALVSFERARERYCRRFIGHGSRTGAAGGGPRLLLRDSSERARALARDLALPPLCAPPRPPP